MMVRELKVLISLRFLVDSDRHLGPELIFHSINKIKTLWKKANVILKKLAFAYRHLGV